MTWRNTEWEDMERIVLPGDPTDADMRSLLTDSHETREMLKEDARTWEEKGLILAIVGISHQWRGVGTVWTLLTDDARARGLVLTRGVLRFLDMLHGERLYWRIQATVEHGDEAARRWILKLGFTYEGTMAAYSPDAKTHDLYARVRFCWPQEQR